MALDATVGGASANSFGTREEANTFFEDRLYTDAWDAALPTKQAKALITACRRISQERFFGEKTTTTQALPFPRVGVKKGDGSYYTCDYYASDEIPTPLKEAQFIYAHELLKSDSISENQMRGIKSLSTGTLSIELESTQIPTSGQMPAEVMRLLRGLVMTGGRVTRA